MLCVDGAVRDTAPLSTGLPVFSRPHKVGTVQKIDLVFLRMFVMGVIDVWMT